MTRAIRAMLVLPRLVTSILALVYERARFELTVRKVGARRAAEVIAPLSPAELGLRSHYEEQLLSALKSHLSM